MTSSVPYYVPYTKVLTLSYISTDCVLLLLVTLYCQQDSINSSFIFYNDKLHALFRE